MRRNKVNCIEAQRLLHAYIDAELETANTLEVEKHLQECNACLKDYNDYQTLRAALREGSLYFHAPELLQKRIASSVRKESKPLVIARLTSRPWLSAAAVLFIALLGMWGLMRLWPTPSANNALAQAVLADHVRSLMVNHLVDVPSSNKHTVKPWFDGKLDFSPPVIDLTAQGFPLVGGRLDYLDNQTVAAIVYKRRSHIVNLFIWPTTQNTARAPTTTTLQGYQLISWTQAGMNYWAVSDLEITELQKFVQLIQQQVGASPPTGQASLPLRHVI
jgi:anti-sigma factor RsiW